ncbi:MAG: ABC transporter ATP-binding protein [Atopobiaceae bacterium]
MRHFIKEETKQSAGSDTSVSSGAEAGSGVGTVAGVGTGAGAALDTATAASASGTADAPATTPIASLRHVTLLYEHGIRALDDLGLDIAPGERLCVLGANGSGKSTLASVLCGLLAPDEGTVDLVGQRVLDQGKPDFAAYAQARRQLGLVFQNPDDQIVTSVVQEDVAFGPENLGVAPDEIGRRVHRELHRVAMEDYALADPTRLSGGQQQRVAIAAALAMEPKVLVLDEPGALLDVRGRRSIMKVMAKLQHTGTTVVHVTHFMEEALQAGRVIVMDRGRIALCGTPAQVFAHADKLAQLGLEQPFSLRLATALDSRGFDVPHDCNEDALRASIVQVFRRNHNEVGKGAPKQSTQARRTAPSQPIATSADEQNAAHASPLATEPRAANDATPTPILDVSHVSYSYIAAGQDGMSRQALDDVSFSVAEGSATAIVGQTGSGKSTLLRIMCALEQPDSGQMLIGGTSTASKADRKRLHSVVGYVMQHPERQLFAETVRKDVAYGPTNLGLLPDEVNQRVDEALDMVGLSHKADASPFELSGGQKRLAALAGILAMRPRVLVLDEPTAGLDPRGRAQLRAILRQVHDSGVTIVQVTHSMEDAVHADHVIVLDRSRVLMDGTPRQVFAPQNAQVLTESGLGLPRPLRLALDLQARGVPSLGNPLTTTQLADALARVASSASATTSSQESAGDAACPSA